MNVWLINPYGPIPGERWRDYRFTLLGRALAKRGHKVIWWTANFSHHFKQFRSENWRDMAIEPGFTIRLVPTTGYVKNIGIGRVRFEVMYAKNLYQSATKLMRPDCIVGIDPSQIVGWISARLARIFNVPLILDVFDLWPELFVLALPRLLRPVAPIVFSPLYLLRRSNLQRAAAITALCETYLQVARKQAPKVASGLYKTIFNGINVIAFREAASDASMFNVNVTKQPGEIWAVYAGSLGINYDVHTLLLAALELEKRSRSIRLWIAGDGPLRIDVTEFIEANHLTQLVYLGKLEPHDLARFYTACDIGICAYAPGSNVAMPDKAYDYMAAGLPIVNSLRGELENFLHDHQIGVQYKAGDPTSLASALESLAVDKGRRLMMARNAYDAAMEFDQNVQYLKFVDLVERVIADAR
jgi:glycosyltransferase involved in cell wall biosynthesis